MRYILFYLLLAIAFISSSSIVNIKRSPESDIVCLDEKELFSVLRNAKWDDSLSFDTSFVCHGIKHHLFCISDFLEECQIYFVIYNYETKELLRSEYISLLNLQINWPDKENPTQIIVDNDTLSMTISDNVSLKSRLVKFSEFGADFNGKDQ